MEQKVDAAGDLLAGRAGHRVEDDRSLLTLEPVDCTDSHALRDPPADAANGEVVRRDYEDVFRSQPLDLAVVAGDRGTGEQILARGGDRLGLFGARLAAPLVVDGERPQPDPGDRS